MAERYVAAHSFKCGAVMPNSATDERPFAFLKKKKTKNAECPSFDTYTIHNPKEAYWHVLVRGCCASDADDSNSIVGKYGHIERANAWTHLIACAVFLVLAFVRPWALGAGSLSAQLSGVSILFTSATFAVSTIYHTYATTPQGVAMRTLDHASIVISLAAANVADLSMVTVNFESVPAQGWLDPVIAAGVLVTYFATRRYVVPKEETREEQFGGKGCSLGLFRTFHSDLEHAALRTGTTATLTILWVLAIPSALTKLPTEASTVWLAGAVGGTLLLICGIVLDNSFILDNFFLQNGNAKIGPCSCASKSMGCALSTHALWHIFAALGPFSALVAREYGISTH